MEGGAGESFIQGGFPSSPWDIRRFSMSFDEPLASALGAGFNHSPQSNQAIVPIFLNGTPGSKPKSFRSSIPIRTMAGFGDGMSEGFHLSQNVTAMAGLSRAHCSQPYFLHGLFPRTQSTAHIMATPSSPPSVPIPPTFMVPGM